MTADLAFETIGHVALVEIRRPPNNYFDLALVAAIADRLEVLDGDPDCRTVLLASQGKHFCAGANFGASAARRIFGGGELYQAALRLFRTRKPIVAAVQGAAVGGGLGLAMAADFRIVGPSARFAANFTAIGFHPGFGLTETLPRAIGAQRAALMFATGDRIGGEEALAIGLADRLAADETLREDAIAFASRIAAAAPLAQQATRATLRQGLADAVAAAVEIELSEQLRLRDTQDFDEGVRASAERRMPRFIGG